MLAPTIRRYLLDPLPDRWTHGAATAE
jgi:hypothetical protein